MTFNISLKKCKNIYTDTLQPARHAHILPNMHSAYAYLCVFVFAGL